MGSPISPIVANLFMEDFEKKAIESSPHPPCFWRRFVDDTFTIIYTAHKGSFLEHLNSIDDHIQFTSEDSRPDGSMPFLDILIRLVLVFILLMAHVGYLHVDKAS